MDSDPSNFIQALLDEQAHVIVELDRLNGRIEDFLKTLNPIQPIVGDRNLESQMSESDISKAA